jgi:hypothetical protein
MKYTNSGSKYVSKTDARYTIAKVVEYFGRTKAVSFIPYFEGVRIGGKMRLAEAKAVHAKHFSN